MMIPRYHPQTGPRDYLSAFARRELEYPAAGIEHSQQAFWLSSGTAGLSLALSAMQLPKDSGIAVPVHACVTVFEAVRAAGHRCVFIDQDPHTFQFDLDSLGSNAPSVAAVVQVHSFGYAGDVAAVAAAAGCKPVVEDCAHAFGSEGAAGRAGSAGVAGVFSFNFHKPVSAGGGGLLLVNDDAMSKRVDRIYHALPGGKARPALLKGMLTSALYRRPCYGAMVRLGLLKLDRCGATAAHVDVQRISSLHKNIVGRRLRALAARFGRQRAIAERLNKSLGSPLPLDNLVRQRERWNGYLCPVLAASAAERDAALAFFHARGIDAFRLWPECLDTSSRFGYVTGTCPQIEGALKRLFFLPLYAELTDRQIERLAAASAEWAAIAQQALSPTYS